MKSCLRVFSIVFTLQFLIAEVSSQCNPAPIINFVNPSFEGTPQAHVTPGPWSICQPGQTPDTQPGSWGINMPPTNGSSYLGLVHQPSTGWQEGASEQLSTPFIAGTSYNFTIDLANILTSDPGIGIIPGCAELRIWGGYGACDRNTLLWSSGNITPWDTWVTYTVGFTPAQNFSWVLFEINSLGCSDGPYILVDNIGPVTPAPPTPVPTAIAATCFGFNTGSAYIGYTGGQAPYSFQWSNGPTTQNNSNLFAGTYGVTITDANQCTATASVVITQPPAIIANVTTFDASCGASNGSATANVTSGNGPFTYLWTNQGTTQTINNLTAGSYSVTVTGAGGCTNTSPATGIVGSSGGLSLSTSPTDATCGINNGSAIVNVTVGTGPFTYLWSNQGTTQTITNLGAGTYDVTVTGAGGCSATASTTLGATGAIILTASSTDATCGSSNGTATVDVTAGIGPFTYLWSNQGTTQTITSLGAGTYDVTVTGAGGCSATTSTTVLASASLSLSMTPGNSPCLANNGSATVDVTAGTGPYTYSWSNLGNTQTITNLMTGTYDVTVIGTGGCSATGSVSVLVGDSTPPVALCQDVTATLTGTTASITAADIDNGSTDNCAIASRTVSPDLFDCSNLGANLTTLTVTDSAGNSSTCNATVTVVGGRPVAVCKDTTVALSGSLVTITPADVDGGSTGDCGVLSATVVPNVFNCSNLGPNNVVLTVTDVAGISSSCNATVTVVDNTPPATSCQDITVSLNTTSVSITAADVDNASTDNCAIVTRTVFPDQFDCSNLGVNTVTFTATDASGNSNSCTASVTVTDVTPPTAICQDIAKSLTGSSPSVIISPSEIDNNSTDNCGIVSRTISPNIFDCSNIGANVVVFTATDASGNSASCNATVTISDDAPPVAIAQDITVSLSGNTVTIDAADVDNNSTDNCTLVSRTVTPNLFDCSNLGPNLVTLTVTDQSGHTDSVTAIVTVLDDTPPTALCKNHSVTLVNGVANITVTDVDNGSTDDCTIVSRRAVPSAFTCANLGVNTVLFTAIDQSGNASSCNAEVTVLGAAPFSCSITSILAPSSQITGGNNTTIYIGYGPQSTTLSTTVTGSGNFTYSWTPGTGLNCTDCLSPVFTPTAEGNYTFTLTVTSSSGCSSTCEITICVLDIRASADCGGNGAVGSRDRGNSPGKVFVCHLPPGNPSNMQLICIGIAGVPAHVPLHGGDRLGRCDQVCASSKYEGDEVPELIGDHSRGFDMLIYPNPFSSQFRIKVESESMEPVNIRMFNVTGQLVISQNGVEPNTDIELGSQLANGFYFMEVEQSGFKQVVRLTKVK